MFKSIGWLSYLKTILFIIVLFYLAVLVMYYRKDIKLAISRKLFGNHNNKAKDSTENSKDPGK
jgi:hypothetical protein